MASALAPPPDEMTVTDKGIVGLLTRVSRNWFLQLATRIQSTSFVLKSIPLTTQSASIGATPIPLPAISAGLYEIKWYLRVTSPAGVSSSVQITIGWTDDGTNLTTSGAVLNGNLVTTHESGSILIEADQSTAITYAISYASNPAGAMIYKLDLLALAVG